MRFQHNGRSNNFPQEKTGREELLHKVKWFWIVYRTEFKVILLMPAVQMCVLSLYKFGWRYSFEEVVAYGC